jgi:hypothetical protein
VTYALSMPGGGAALQQTVGPHPLYEAIATFGGAAFSLVCVASPGNLGDVRAIPKPNALEAGGTGDGRIVLARW